MLIGAPLSWIVCMWVPFRWELLVTTLVCLASSDARGAQWVYTTWITPRVQSLSIRTEKMRVAFVDHAEPSERVEPNEQAEPNEGAEPSEQVLPTQD